MAHDGTGHGWDITAPADSDPRRLGAQEIRDLRTGVGIRMDKEHDTLAPGSGGGEHKAGSAKAYMQNSAPTTRPSGDSLSSDDKGRLWVRETDGVLHSYDGSQFIALSGGLDTVKLTGNQTVNGDKDFRGTTTVVSLRVNPQSSAIHEIAGLASRLDLNPSLHTSDQNAQVGMFRQTNTTGEKSLQLYRGNGTTESSARIGVDGGDSWFQVHGGGVVIGSASRTSSAILDLNSTTMGFRPPRVTTTQRNNISDPASGLMVYNTSTTRFEFYTGSQWEPIGSGDNVVTLTGTQTISGSKTFTSTVILNNHIDMVSGSSSHRISNGTSLVDISPRLNTSDQDAYASVFRFTNTSGTKYFYLNRGNGTSSFSARIGVDGADTVFQNHGGGIVVGAVSRSPSAILDLQSTTMGFRPPRMTTTQRDAITSPAAGLMIFNTTANKTQIYNGSSWNDFDSTSLSLLNLDDTPASYSGQDGKLLTVNSDGTGIQFSSYFSFSEDQTTLSGTTVSLSSSLITPSITSPGGIPLSPQGDPLLISGKSGTVTISGDGASGGTVIITAGDGAAGSGLGASGGDGGSIEIRAGFGGSASFGGGSNGSYGSIRLLRRDSIGIGSEAVFIVPSTPNAVPRFPLGVRVTHLILENLPTTEPFIAGMVWNDNGTLKVSSG